MTEYGRVEGTYARDADRLFREYTNLRMSLYNKYQSNFNNPATKDELMSYIDEQFVKLVKEYDINSPVDFPGYVKTKLTSRVAYGFVGRKFRDKNREVILREEGAIKDYIDDQEIVPYNRLEMRELMEHLFSGEGLNDLSWDILKGWLNYDTEREITVGVAEKHKTTYAEVDREKERIRVLVRDNLETYK